MTAFLLFCGMSCQSGRFLLYWRKHNEVVTMYSRVYVEITNICNMSRSFCHGHSRASGR